jgi:hypothetical protein
MYKVQLYLEFKVFGVRCDFRADLQTNIFIMCFLVFSDEYKTLTLNGVQHS